MQAKIYLEAISVVEGEPREQDHEGLELDRLLHYLDYGVPWAHGEL